jgi:nucleotide-binding universal stress UspA family protein
LADRRRGGVVDGVDGSEPSQRALQWAPRYAAATGATVTAIHAWQVPPLHAAVVMLLPTDEFAEAEQAVLDTAMERAEIAVPGVRAERRLIQGHPAKELIDQSADADLLVVGSRGLGGFAGSTLGSVSQLCVQNAACPVVVVRGED